MLNDDFKHCDNYIDDETQPECLRKFLDYVRSPPAMEPCEPLHAPSCLPITKGSAFASSWPPASAMLGSQPT